jgi:hypothetical protein
MNPAVPSVTLLRAGIGGDAKSIGRSALPIRERAGRGGESRRSKPGKRQEHLPSRLAR